MLEYLNPLVPGQHRRGRGGRDPDQLVRTRIGPQQLPEVAVLAVPDHPAAVAEQLADRPARQLTARQRRQQRADRVVEPQPAPLDQPEHQHRGVGLGVRGDPEPVPLGERDAGRLVGATQRRRQPRRAVGGHAGLHAGNPQEPAPVVQPVAVVVQDVLRNHDPAASQPAAERRCAGSLQTGWPGARRRQTGSQRGRVRRVRFSRYGGGGPPDGGRALCLGCRCPG